MNLREELVTLGELEYRVREISAREMIPIMESMQGGEGEAADGRAVDFSQKVFERAVTVDGVTVSYDDIPGWAYMRLLPIVMRLNGMLNAGND